MRVPKVTKSEVQTVVIVCFIVTFAFPMFMSLLIYLEAQKLFPLTANDTLVIDEVCANREEDPFRIAILIAGAILFTLIITSHRLCIRSVNKRKSKRESDVRKFNHIDTRLVKTYDRTRIMYKCLRRTGDYPHVEMVLDDKVSLLKHRSILAGLGHPNLVIGSSEDSSLILTEYIYYFYDLQPEDHFIPPHFTQMAVITRDVLRAVQYLQANHIYHLDLQPNNIQVCWSCQDVRSCMAKVGGFDFAKRLEDGKVSCKETGLNGFWRPPEYFLDDGTLEVDAAKIDAWSIGITAYELLSGRMLTILADSTIPAASTFAELVSTRHVMEQKHFSSIIESSLCIITDMEYYPLYKSEISMYDLNHKIFIKDCCDFVRGLLESDPEKRFSVERALNTPLITKVRDEPEARTPSRKLLAKCVNEI